MDSRLRACEKIGIEHFRQTPQRHSREGRNPFIKLEQALRWTPASAGATLRPRIFTLRHFFTRSKAGIHGRKKRRSCMCSPWVPAFAGTTLRLESACAFTCELASTAVSRIKARSARRSLARRPYPQPRPYIAKAPTRRRPCWRWKPAPCPSTGRCPGWPRR